MFTPSSSTKNNNEFSELHFLATLDIYFKSIQNIYRQQTHTHTHINVVTDIKWFTLEIYICSNATRKVLGKVPKECTEVATYEKTLFLF